MGNKNPLEGKKALVTGASSGIGLETSRALARNGANVSLAARRKEKLEKLANEIEENYGTETFVAPTNVRAEDQVNEMVEKTVDEFGALDILVNNAGVAEGGAIEDLTTEQYRKLMETNDGIFFTTRAALPHLRKSRGNLIFIGSLAGEYPRPTNPIYTASKWWLRGFALSVETNVGAERVGVTIRILRTFEPS